MATASPPAQAGAGATPDFQRPAGIDDYLIFHLHQVARAATVGIDLHLRRTLGIGRRDWRVLAFLADRPGIRLTEFASSAGLGKVVASRVLNSLVARGVVLRDRQPGDKRAVSLRLTDKGVQLHRAALAATAAYNTRLARTLSADEARLLQAVLPALAQRAAALLQDERALAPGLPREGAPGPDLDAVWHGR